MEVKRIYNSLYPFPYQGALFRIKTHGLCIRNLFYADHYVHS